MAVKITSKPTVPPTTEPTASEINCTEAKTVFKKAHEVMKAPKTPKPCPFKSLEDFKGFAAQFPKQTAFFGKLVGIWRGSAAKIWGMPGYWLAYPYPLWAEEGFIIPTPGTTIDYATVEDTIRQLCERFQVREIAFDPHMAHNMMQSLMDDGFPVVAMRQGWMTMAPATKETERAILAGQLTHGGNPVLRHHFDVAAVHTDSAGNRLLRKGRSKDRIDAAIATIMAVGRASTGEDNRSVYDSDERPEGLLIF